MQAEVIVSYVDDVYNRLAKNIGNDFASGKDAVSELFSLHCPDCGYRNIHNVKRMTCGCGKILEGALVFRKVGDTVIYDARGKTRTKKR